MSKHLARSRISENAISRINVWSVLWPVMSLICVLCICVGEMCTSCISCGRVSLIGNFSSILRYVCGTRGGNVFFCHHCLSMFLELRHPDKFSNKNHIRADVPRSNFKMACFIWGLPEAANSLTWNGSAKTARASVNSGICSTSRCTTVNSHSYGTWMNMVQVFFRWFIDDVPRFHL